VKKTQRGSMIVGLIIGVVIGLGIALAVAVYVTKVPVPFLNRGATRSPDQDAAESRKNRDWDPNAPLYGKNPAKPLPPAQAPGAGASGSPAAAPPVATIPAPGATPPAASSKSRDPLGDLAAARSAKAANDDPFFYFVQAGAFRTPEDAESQRAKLSLMGVDAKVTEREQSGRQVFRVRVGPFDRKEDADRQKEKLDTGGFETALVRVQR
jgi:cell division protein FtsN